jgi:hypothetical protein
MVDIVNKGKPFDQRISDRLKSSGEGAKPDLMVKKGDGPTRTITHLHHSASNAGSTTKQKNAGAAPQAA